MRTYFNQKHHQETLEKFQNYLIVGDHCDVKLRKQIDNNMYVALI